MQFRVADRGLSESGLVAGAALTMLVAGLVHLAIAPLHWEHAPAHATFLFLAGVAEIAWGVVFWRRPSAELYRAGVVLAGGLITLWAITRLLPAPFGHGPEEVEVYGILSKVSEGVSLGALAALAVTGAAFRVVDRSSVHKLVGLVAVSFLVGGLTYAVAAAAQPALPWLSAYDPDEAAEQLEAGQGQLSSEPLRLVTAGIARPFENGGEVPIAGDVEARLTLSQGRARGSRTLDVRLFHERAVAEAVADATILATGRMRFMDHGTFRQAALAAEDGHYLLPLQFAMPGEWQLELEITTPERRSTVVLELDLLE